MLAQQIDDAVQQVVLSSVREGQFRSYTGQAAEQLALQLQSLVGVSQCLLACSGTAALEICLRAAGIGSGDEVLLSSYDYPGNFWAVERVGGRPVLIDSEADSWHISREQLEDLAATAAISSCKALIASHLHGQLQDAAWLRRFCDRHGLLFVEDCCQALGGEVASKTTGAHGHAAIFSFGGGKLLSAGRGGALLTDSEHLAQKARLAAGAGSGPYALSELQAAIVLAQLPWLTELNRTCRDYFRQVHQSLLNPPANLRTRFMMPAADQLEVAGCYQAGWLIGTEFDPPGPSQAVSNLVQTTEAIPAGEQLDIYDLSQIVSLLRAANIPAGRGFEGFHRRSPRRCRAPFALQHVRHVVRRTLVIHHRVALDKLHRPQDVARTIISVLR